MLIILNNMLIISNLMLSYSNIIVKIPYPKNTLNYLILDFIFIII